MRVDFKNLAEKWPSAIVARTEVHRFSGGVLNSKYRANLDSLGKGPKGRIRVGRQIVYSEALVEFMEERAEAVE
ncbi:MAG: hypothetical protein JRI91_16850 [Deltaproteobacteria bacterium]|nr:hypothetical protein [Deltaproteobacteria bacterium]